VWCFSYGKTPRFNSRIMKRYALALDLKNDPLLIAEYEQWHKNVWPEIKQSILSSGIRRMEIYRFSHRLFMIMETDEGFTFESKAAADEANPARAGMGTDVMEVSAGGSRCGTRREVGRYG